MLLHTLVFSMIAISLVIVFVSWANTSIKSSRSVLYKQQALQIAESGIDYYRWHLSHSANDFQDGTGTTGPYVHTFYDKDNVAIGSFTLTITPPPVGSTLVTIKSEGRVDAMPSIKKTIQSKLAIPSFAKFAMVTNSDIRFGEGTEIFGPIHSNGGIRFDGIAHNLVTSAVSSYNDPDHNGNVEFGVHTHVNPPPSSGTNDTFRSAEAPNSSIASRNDVFLVGRQFPVPQADFTGITSDLSIIKSNAQSSGHYYGASGSIGYHIVFKTNDTYDLYRVTNLENASSSCSNYSNSNNADSTWGTWSIKASGGQVLLG
jgi:hypothetical protein